MKKKEVQDQANSIFMEYLIEDSDYPTTFGLPKVGPTDGVPSADDDIKSAHQVTTDPEMLDRFNPWLAALTQRPYINAYSVIMYLRQKMAISGLDFKEPSFKGDAGSESVPVTQWGNPTSLNLHFNWVKVRGWYTISANLVGVVKLPEEIQEEGTDVDESSNPFSILNQSANNRKNKIQRLFKRNSTPNRIVAKGMRAAIREINTGSHALKAAIGTGGYTHTQGRGLHIHTKALRGKSTGAIGTLVKVKKMS